MRVRLPRVIRPSSWRFFESAAGARLGRALLSRRALVAAGPAWLALGQGQAPGPTWRTGGATYDTEVSGIRIFPGQWRPHYPWEQIAWISPPWPSQDYLWLDFPEAFFTSQGLLFLSHVNPSAPTVFSGLPKVEWRPIAGGIAFERTLPNRVRFGGRVTKAGERLVELELFVHNGSAQPLRDIVFQTCLYLRAIREFAEFTRDNKFVHVPSSGWVSLSDALLLKESKPAPYRVGWRRSGRAVADLPVIATVSNQAERLVAMTWHGDTLSLIGNPRHPCMHADPRLGDLEAGQGASIRGPISFFQGKLPDFDWLKETASAGPAGTSK